MNLEETQVIQQCAHGALHGVLTFPEIVGSTAGMMAISVMAIGVFSAFMLYDLKRIVDGGETNYISATLGLYLSAFNVFQSLLALLGIAGGERD